MRCAKFGIALLLALSLLCLLGTQRLGRIVSDTAAALEQAQQLAALDRLDEAAQAAGQAHAHWRAHRLFLGALLRHSDADELEYLFARLPHYAAGGDGDELRAACSELSARLARLLETEQPHLYNIL